MIILHNQGLIPAVTCLFLSYLSLHAQEFRHDEPDPRVQYYNRTSTGIFLGDEEGQVMGSLTTVQGIGFRHWSIGVGSGIEGYERWRVVPLFGSATFHFCGHSDNGIFIQLNAGHSFGKLLMADEGLAFDGTKGGPMINPMIGYQVSTKKLVLFLAAGYKAQRIAGSYMSNWSVRYTIEEKTDRFLFQIGFGIR